MPRRPVYTKKFEKDVKRMKRRGKQMEKLKAVLSLLVEGKPLDRRYRDHKLKGEYKGRRDCHIEDDWVLIYKLGDGDTVVFERTGTHSDLFD